MERFSPATSATGAPPRRDEFRAASAALLAAGAGWAGLRCWPGLEIGLFARTAAQLAGLLTGSPVLPADSGWQLPAAQTPVLVSAACSGADYFLIVTALAGWWLARRGRPLRLAVPVALATALPLAVAVNALRVAALTQAHRWIIPMFPTAYARYLHLLTGVAVFLPALIAIHLLLERHGRPRSHPAA